MLHTQPLQIFAPTSAGDWSDYDLEDLPLKDSHRTADRRLDPDVVVVSKKGQYLWSLERIGIGKPNLKG